METTWTVWKALLSRTEMVDAASLDAMTALIKWNSETYTRMHVSASRIA